MIGKPICRNAIGRMRGARRSLRCAACSADGRSVLAATTLLFALLLQAFEVRAELLFRSARQIDGQAQWSEPRNYANPADTVYPRTLADGTQVPSEDVQVFLQGYITQQDVYSAKVMESLIRRGRQKLAGNAVSFAGSGGDVDAALEMGRVLRRLGVSAVVAQGEQCLSSCVFAFMGGDQRSVAGRIGIHRPYFSSARKVPDRRSYYRELQKRLQQYIEELDFPPSLYEAFMAVPPESIHILTAAELKKFYLQGMSPAAEDEADATAARRLGISVADFLQQKAQRQPCAGVFDSDGNCVAQSAADAGARPVHEKPAPAARGVARQDIRESEDPGTMRGAVTAPGTAF